MQFPRHICRHDKSVKFRMIQHIIDESLVKLCSLLTVIDRVSFSDDDKSSHLLAEGALSERKINCILSGLSLLWSSDPPFKIISRDVLVTQSANVHDNEPMC